MTSTGHLASVIDDCNEILRCQYIYEAFREDDLLALAINNDHVMTLDNGWDLQRIHINQSINQPRKEMVNQLEMQ